MSVGVVQAEARAVSPCTAGGGRQRDTLRVGYTGQLLPWAATWLNLTVEIVKRPDDLHTFQLLPRRWVVEWTLAWITSYHCCARDYERLPASHEATIYWAMITLMTRRLGRPG